MAHGTGLVSEATMQAPPAKAGSVALDVTKRLMSPAGPAAPRRPPGAGGSRAQACRMDIARRRAWPLSIAAAVERPHRQRHHRCPGGSTGRLARHADAAELPDPSASRRIRRAAAGPAAAYCQLTSVGFLAAAGPGRGRARDCPARRPGSSPAPWRKPGSEPTSRTAWRQSRTGWVPTICGGRSWPFAFSAGSAAILPRC